MAHELKHPANGEQRQRPSPPEEEQRPRDRNHRDADCMTELVQRVLMLGFVVVDQVMSVHCPRPMKRVAPLGHPGMQSPFMLSLGYGEREQAIHCLRDSVSTARFEINLATLSANPGFDAGDSHFDPLSLELLRDRFSTQLALTFRTRRFHQSVHSIHLRLVGVLHQGLSGM